jgi:hypothetical protein
VIDAEMSVVAIESVYKAIDQRGFVMYAAVCLNLGAGVAPAGVSVRADNLTRRPAPLAFCCGLKL